MAFIEFILAFGPEPARLCMDSQPSFPSAMTVSMRSHALERLGSAHRLHALRRRETVAARAAPRNPGTPRARARSRQQLARLQEAIQRRQRTHFGRRDAAQDVLGPELRRDARAPPRTAAPAAPSACCSWKWCTRVGLVGHVQLLPALRVLRGDAGRAAVGVAALRLDAAEREHETARGVAPVRAQRQRARDVERAGDHLAGRADADACRADPARPACCAPASAPRAAARRRDR